MKQVLSVAAAICCAGLIAGCQCPCMKSSKSSACQKCDGATACESVANKCPYMSSVKSGVITTDALRALIRAKSAMTLLDARSGKYDDGNRIPGAKALAPDASEVLVKSTLPDKQMLVITYCVNPKCPASHELTKRLRQLGYTNVLEYYEGIEAWMAAGNPVEKATR
jgi:rhodanese-related sulfurtransferase